MRLLRSSIGEQVGVARHNLASASKLASDKLAGKLASALLAGAICSTSLVLPPPAFALPPTELLNTAIVEASEASYPIIRSLDPQTFPSWSSLLGKVILEIDSAKLGRAMDLGVSVGAQRIECSRWCMLWHGMLRCMA